MDQQQQLRKSYVNIISNGSQFYGEPPDSIERLLEVLAVETLDPRFERLGGFIRPAGGNGYDFFGNFLTVSHVFHIITTDEEIISSLAAAIYTNQGTSAYKSAKTHLENARRESELEMEKKRLRRQAERGTT